MDEVAQEAYLLESASGLVMDEVAQEAEKVKNEWYEPYSKTQEHVEAIREYGKSGRSEEKNSLPRLNGMAQDGLALLSSLQFRLDLLAPQLLTDEEAESASSVLESWKTQSQSLRSSLRNANLQAKENMKKAAQEERELFLGGGRESTVRRCKLQTKAGMTTAAESITESLLRTRELLVQEVGRCTSTVVIVEETTGVGKKAESEMKGQRSWPMDRIMLGAGFFLFSLAVLYVVSKRIGRLTL